MPEEKEKIKENPTIKLKKLVLKREIPIIIDKQNQHQNYSRRINKTSISSESYYSFDDS